MVHNKEKKIDIWWAKYKDASIDLNHAYRNILCHSEQEKADSFSKESLRHKYIISRFILKTTIALYIKIAPNKVNLTFNRYGKPNLAYPSKKLFFNLSHTQEHFLLAVSEHTEIGIDTEILDTNSNIVSLAKMFFSSHEYRQLTSIKKEIHNMCVLSCWVSKEAYLKYLGTGLNIPPSDFSIDIDPNRIAQLLTPENTERNGLYKEGIIRKLAPLCGFSNTISVIAHENTSVDYSNIRWQGY